MLSRKFRRVVILSDKLAFSFKTVLRVLQNTTDNISQLTITFYHHHDKQMINKCLGDSHAKVA